MDRSQVGTEVAGQLINKEAFPVRCLWPKVSLPCYDKRLNEIRTLI